MGKSPRHPFVSVWVPKVGWFGALPFLHRWRKRIIARKILVNREGVFVDDRQLVRRSDVHAAWLTENKGFWFAQVSARRAGLVTIRVVDEEDGMNLIRALNADAGSITARYGLLEPGAGARFIALFAAVLMAFVAAVVLKHHAMRHASELVLLGSLVAMVAGLYLNMVRVVVGADGLVVRKGLHHRFIPHDQIVEAKRDGGDLVVTLKEGELRFQMTVTRNGTALREQGIAHAETIAKRINAARAVYEELGGDPTCVPALARAGKTTGDWLDALRRIGKDVDSGFRGGVIGRERLWMLVESTQMPPAFRVSAAVALRVSGEDANETSLRLRELAEACATPNLGKRLRIAASATEAELEELLDENDETELSAFRSWGS